MPKVTIEVPEGFEEVVKELEQTLQRAQKGVEGAQAGDMEAFDEAWQSVNAGASGTSRRGKPSLSTTPSPTWRTTEGAWTTHPLASADCPLAAAPWRPSASRWWPCA